MRSIQKLLGARLKEMREQQQLRVIEVAAALDVEPGTVYAIERGDHPPSMTLFMDFAKLYKVDEADLLTWPGTHPRHDLRELVRLTPNAKLNELKEAWEKILGSKSKARPRPRH
jgi:transcriptional regulator with XRE-family HTH domain